MEPLPPPPPLSEREEAVLRVLGEPGAVVAFQGLRRDLGLHPEVLSRVLRRLERGGWIERTDGGYRRGPRAPEAPGEAASDPPGVAVLEARLPPGVSPAAVAEALDGRWVGPLRWHGVRDGGARLRWTSPGGDYRVDLRLEAGALAIEVYAQEDAWTDAVRAAYGLFGQIGARLHPAGPV